MSSIEFLERLWPGVFKNKIVKVIITVLIITLIFLTIYKLIAGDENQTQKQLTATEQFVRLNATAPVKLIFANLVGAELVAQWFNYGKIISLTESKFEKFHYSKVIDYVNVPREFNSKRDVERYFGNLDDDLLVVSGSVQLIGDTSMFLINFNPICQFKDLLTVGHISVTVENNSMSLINRFMTQFVDEIIVRFNTLYIYHLSEAQEYNELVKFVKESIPIYDNLDMNKPSNDYYSFLYSMICEAYINLDQEDSALKYAGVGYDVSPNSYHCYNYKSQALLINSADNIDSLKFALSLIFAAKEPIRIGTWQRDAFVSRVYAEMCQIESNTQNFDDAIKYADSSIYLDPTFFKPRLLKAMILLYNCKLEEASINIDLAFERDSALFHTNYYLAIISALKGDFKNSRIYFNNAFLIQPKEFLLEYGLNVYTLEKCEYKYMDSVKSYTSRVAIYE